MLKAPRPDPALDPLREGIAVLRREGEISGHVASSVSTFWSPSRPLSRQWWVWFIVIWANGDGERAFEDYPPWTTVLEIQTRNFTWDDDGEHRGTYTVEWLTGKERESARAALGVKPEDF